jgi:phosphatidyl-myo-inositol dimannoside synthase
MKKLTENILFISQNYPPGTGGIETYSFELCKALSKTAQITVLSPSQKDGLSFDRKHLLNVYRHWSNHTLFPWLIYFKIKEIVSNNEITTVICSSWLAAVSGILAKKTGIVKKVYTAAHGQEVFNYPAKNFVEKNIRKRLRKWVFSNVDGVLAVSKYTSEMVKETGIDEKKIFVLNNGVDITGWDNLRQSVCPDNFLKKHSLENSRIISTVARLITRKGIDSVIKSLPIIIREVAEIKYVIAGTGPDRNRLEEIAVNYGVRDKIVFIENISKKEIAELYSVSDIFVMPAREEKSSVEGFGIVFREAAVFEVPAIGSTSGGIPDAVIHEKTGILVPSEDEKMLSESILLLLQDPELSSYFGKCGRKLVEKEGSWDHVAEKLMKIIEQV